MSADLHALTGAYAADAVSDAERLAFEHHLDACPACSREVRELRSTAARLGAAVASPPPADLWDRVKAEAQVTRQLPPVTERGGRRRLPPLVAAAAAVLAVGISLAALNLGLAGRVGRPERAVSPVAAVLSAPDARTVAAQTGGAGRVAVVVSRERGQAVFVASGLPPAPAARTYQLWLIGPSGPHPAGLVDPGGEGRVTRLLDGRVSGGEVVAMTVERRGGSLEPTSRPVAVVELEA